MFGELPIIQIVAVRPDGTRWTAKETRFQNGRSVATLFNPDGTVQKRAGDGLQSLAAAFASLKKYSDKLKGKS